MVICRCICMIVEHSVNQTTRYRLTGPFQTHLRVAKVSLLPGSRLDLFSIEVLMLLSGHPLQLVLPTVIVPYIVLWHDDITWRIWISHESILRYFSRMLNVSSPPVATSPCPSISIYSRPKARPHHVECKPPNNAV